MSTSRCLSRKAKNGSSLSPTMCRRPMFNPNKSAKSIEKKRCARPIYAQSYATKSPVLMISLSSKVSSMLWCKSSRPMVRVSQSLKCVAAELCGPSLSTKSRPQKVASFTSSTSSSRGPKSNKRVERLSLIIGALKICRRAVVLLPMPVERRQRGLQGKTICGEKPLPFGEKIGSFFGPKE